MSTLQLEKLRPILLAGREKMVGDLDQVRRGFEEMLGQFPQAPGTATPVDIDGIPAVWFTPPVVVKDRVLLYLHGGGYVVGSPRAYLPLASELAGRIKARVLIADYRLAPENPYPAALQDAVQVYSWLLAQGTPAGSITLAGDSAGGGLTLATMVAVRDGGLPLPAGAAIISPWADLSLASESITTKDAEDELLGADGLRGMASTYLGATPPRTPEASPLYANLKGLPPLLIQVGSTEVLLDDSTRLAAIAGAAGVRVRLDIWPHMFHVWHSYSSLLDEAVEALDDAGAFLTSLLQAAPFAVTAQA
jgi:epsilon-lactone hydrolase